MSDKKDHPPTTANPEVRIVKVQRLDGVWLTIEYTPKTKAVADVKST